MVRSCVCRSDGCRRNSYLYRTAKGQFGPFSLADFRSWKDSLKQKGACRNVKEWRIRPWARAPSLRPPPPALTLPLSNDAPRTSGKWATLKVFTLTQDEGDAVLISTLLGR